MAEKRALRVARSSPVVDLQFVPLTRQLYALHDSTFSLTAFPMRRNRSAEVWNVGSGLGLLGPNLVLCMTQRRSAAG